MIIRAQGHTSYYCVFILHILSVYLLISTPCYGALEDRDELEISVIPARMLHASEGYQAYAYMQPGATTSLTGINGEPFAEEYADDPAETNVNITMTRRTERVDLKTHFNANYNFNPEQTDSIDQTIQVNEFYMDALDSENALSTRIGRQPYSIAGSKGHFDGITLGYRLFNRQKMNLVAGYTQNGAVVDNPGNERTLYGINIDSGKLAKRWQANLYLLGRAQQSGSSRQVVGSRLHYLHPAHPARLTVDIDPQNDELNNANLRLDFKLPSRNSIHFTIDYCKPGTGLSAGVASLDELLGTLPAEESLALEQEPSALFRSTGIFWSKQFGNNIALNSKTAFSSLDRVASSGEVYTLNQHYFGLEFIRNDLNNSDTSSRLSFRYLENDLDNHMILSFHNRFKLRRAWLADLLVEADWQKQIDQSRAMSLNPSLRLHYNDRERRSLEVELGLKQAEIASLSDSLHDNDFYLRITHSFPL